MSWRRQSGGFGRRSFGRKQYSKSYSTSKKSGPFRPKWAAEFQKRWSGLKKTLGKGMTAPVIQDLQTKFVTDCNEAYQAFVGLNKANAKTPNPVNVIPYTYSQKEIVDDEEASMLRLWKANRGTSSYTQTRPNSKEEDQYEYYGIIVPTTDKNGVPTLTKVVPWPNSKSSIMAET